MESKPEWFDYIVWETKDGEPTPKGFKKDTPKEMIEKYKKDYEAFWKNQEEHPDEEF